MNKKMHLHNCGKIAEGKSGSVVVHVGHGDQQQRRIA
jgi:hypothetical protein